MQPFEIRLAYQGRHWLTLEFELGHDEVGSTEDRDLRIADDIVETFATIGLEEPAPIPLMLVEHQVAQKLHACTYVNPKTGRNDRAHDLVDLQILEHEDDRLRRASRDRPPASSPVDAHTSGRPPSSSTTTGTRSTPKPSMDSTFSPRSPRRSPGERPHRARRIVALPSLASFVPEGRKEKAVHGERKRNAAEREGAKAVGNKHDPLTVPAVDERASV